MDGHAEEKMHICHVCGKFLAGPWEKLFQNSFFAVTFERLKIRTEHKDQNRRELNFLYFRSLYWLELSAIKKLIKK